MRNANLTIMLLLASAAVLTALLAVQLLDTPAARADSSVRGGDYIVVPGAYNSNFDMIYILDVSAQKLNVYELDFVQSKGLELRDQLDLNKVFPDK